jgi:hypothetical protein
LRAATRRRSVSFPKLDPLFGALWNTRVSEQPGIDFLIDIQPWRQCKTEALRVHCSQHLAIDRIFFNSPDIELLLSVEIFRQAWGPPLSQRPLDDLFADLETSESIRQ